MKPVDAEENPGLAKLPTEVRNKMGYMKKGGLMKKAKRFDRGGDIDDNETEIIFDNRTVKSDKLPSDTSREESKEPVKKSVSRPKATSLSEPRVKGKTFTETIANAKVPAPKVTEKKPEMPKPDPSPGPLGFKGLRSFFSGMGKPYGAEKFEKEQKMKKGLEAGGMKAGGKVSSASKRADGCAVRGKTRA
jgi:hypothetical protein